MDARCPRKLTKYPKSPCRQGREAVDAAKEGKEAGCPWSVADGASCYCFFKFLADEGDRPIPTAKIAALLQIDDDEVKKILQKFKSIAGGEIELAPDLPQI
jgi:hypothetical protein